MSSVSIQIIWVLSVLSYVTVIKKELTLFIVPACKLSGPKIAQVHACKQYYWLVL